MSTTRVEDDDDDDDEHGSIEFHKKAHSTTKHSQTNTKNNNKVSYIAVNIV